MRHGSALALLTVAVVLGGCCGPFARRGPKVPAGWIAFTSARDRRYHIYLMRTDGTDVTRLTNGSWDDTDPDWSPDGTRIVFVSNRDDVLEPEIYVMNADGSGQTRLTFSPDDDESPAWSPDGTKIAFTSHRDRNDEIYVMNADGSEQTRLTNNPGSDLHPAWSPDGRHIVFFSNRNGYAGLYIMNADGSAPRPLAHGGLWPTWSPDGVTLAFSDGFPSHIYTAEIDGTGLQCLTPQGRHDNHPSWSPDGAWIAFTSERDFNQEIYVMRADGSEQVRLTHNFPFADYDPAWRP